MVKVSLDLKYASSSKTITLTFLQGERDSAQCKVPLVRYNSVYHDGWELG